MYAKKSLTVTFTVGPCRLVMRYVYDEHYAGVLAIFVDSAAGPVLVQRIETRWMSYRDKENLAGVKRDISNCGDDMSLIEFGRLDAAAQQLE